MTCEGCVKDVSGSLYKLSGIQKVDANLKEQLLSIEGTGDSPRLPPRWDVHGTIVEEYRADLRLIAAPSAIVAAIQETGRDAILRGSGASNSMLSTPRTTLQGL